MNNQNLILEIERYLNKLRSKENNINQYYAKELRDMSDRSKIMYLTSICKLFENNEQRNRSRRTKNLNSTILENVDINKLTKQDINDFLSCEWFDKLSNNTKNQYLIRIKKYLKFSNREDLIEELGDKSYKEEERTLSKTDLISREDLELILKYCNLKLKTLIMVLYEGALRIDEALNIRLKHIKFNGGYAILRVEISKTKQRDIPLIESIPYLKEYLNNKHFEPNDKIFPYKWNSTVNGTLDYLKKRLIRQYPEWKNKKLNPHIFRHSRLTELAAGKLNEAQIRKFAGWTPSSNMADIYFHLDDSDIIKILTNEEIQKPKPKKFKPIVCPICNVENNQQNYFCWKCNNILDETKRAETGLNLINLKENQEKIIRLLMNLYFKRITKEEYPDMELSREAEFELINQIVREYNDMIK